MPPKSRGTQLTPYEYDSGPDYVGKHITISIAFDNVTRVLISATVHRDADCIYKKIYIGLGPDGTPDTTPMVFDASTLNTPPDPDKIFTAIQMAAVGLTTIEDVLQYQITAGP